MSLQGWKGTNLTTRQWRLRSISNQNTICGTTFISWFWWGWRTQLSTLDLRATWPRWLRSVNKRLLCFVLFFFPCSSMILFMLLQTLKLCSLLGFAQVRFWGSPAQQTSDRRMSLRLQGCAKHPNLFSSPSTGETCLQTLPSLWRAGAQGG